MLPSHADLFDRHTETEPIRLPPLILHPFSAAEDAALLLESSRASLKLNGFVPRENEKAEELESTLLRGRYAELKMLFYIGKDVLRWTDQCSEMMSMQPSLGRRIQPETFALYLIQHIPAPVRVKLEGWGVADYVALFRRSIGMHSVFATMPSPQQITADFLVLYHRHLDLWYEFRMRNAAFDRASAGEFTFDLYASGEYTMMLEKSWSDSDSAGQ